MWSRFILWKKRKVLNRYDKRKIDGNQDPGVSREFTI
jgi:hypothetical protein